MLNESQTDDSPSFTEPVSILLVDDDVAWATATARLLEHNVSKFTVEVADSLGQGRSRYLEGDHDCIVCDYQLGDGTGLGLLETVRESDDKVPFILVTGRGDEDLASEATREGITKYIIKSDDGKQADLLSNQIANAVRSYRTQLQLDRERRSKNTLLRLMTAATDERTLYDECCRLLAEEHRLPCVWIGSPTEDGKVVPRAVSSDDDSLKEAVYDPSDGNPVTEPVIRALDENRTVRYVASETSDATKTRFPEELESFGVKTVAGVPLTHQDMSFGVLGVYGNKQTPISKDRLGLVKEFADTVGYAVHTAEFKRSLLSEQTTTITFRLSDASIPLISLERSVSGDCRLAVPSVSLREDGSTLYVVRTRDADASELKAAVEDADWATLTKDTSLAEGDRFQSGLIADRETPESLLAERGAEVVRLSVENGVKQITVNVPRYGMISELEEALGSKFGEVKINSVHQDPAEQEPGATGDLLEPLTRKQKDALRQAYYEGFFEHPREVNATELADRFDVSRQTITYHLRAAESKVFGQVFDRNQEGSEFK